MKSHPNAFKFINLTYLDTLLGDDEETKHTMLTMLLDEIPQEIGIVRQAVKDDDMERLRKTAHKLKSTLAFVGNQEIEQANKTIEKIAKEGLDKTPLPALVEVMDRLMPEILSEIKQALEQ